MTTEGEHKRLQFFGHQFSTSNWEYKMIDENFARLRTHRGNIQRYRHLLETSLTDFEREFVSKAACGRAVGVGNALCGDANKTILRFTSTA